MSTFPFLEGSEQLHEKALQRTSAVLGKIDEIRRKLELPVEQLPIVIEIYGQAIAALHAEAEREARAKHTKRLPLTMRSENRDFQPMKIKAGRAEVVIGRPQACTFRPEDIAIHGDRLHWRVHDIQVGNRSQFASNRCPAAGTEFGLGGILEHLRLDVVHPAMDFRLFVEYVGPEVEGEVFEATIVGTATDF